MQLLENYGKWENIERGWSGDQKYCVTDEAGKRYLLRVSPIERRARVQTTYARMQAVAELGIPMCRPIACGTTDTEVYVLHSWVDGRDAEEVLPTLSEETQYAYGLDAGNALRAIHTLPASDSGLCWEEHFNRKIDRKIQLYTDCALHYEQGHLLLDYIKANRHLLKDRPVTYQHGDFHVGNMMIDRAGKLVIIDFDRDDCGDPWEEFNRIVWSAQCAPAFARGIVDGYFAHQVPTAFWQLLALYIATNTLSSLPWAIPFGEKEVAVMRHQCDEVLHWYDGMQNPIPSWYRAQ